MGFGAFRVSLSNPGLRLLDLARLASVTGRWAYTVTLAVFAYRSAGAGGVAIAGLIRLFPAGAAAPLAGALVRRARMDTLLLWSGALRTIALAAAGVVVLADGPSAAVYALVAVEAAASALSRPLQSSLLPELAHTPEELTATNVALSTIESAGVLVGPLIGAALLALTSVGTVFIAAAFLYLASMLLLLPLHDRGRHDAGARRPFLVEAADGARSVMRDHQARVVVALYGAQNFGAGMLNVLIVVTALQILDAGESGVGILTAAVGAGGVVGGALVAARLRNARYGSELGRGLLLWGVPLLLLAFAGSMGTAFALLAVVGIGATIVDVSSVTLLQRNLSRELLPHALGFLQTSFAVALGVGTVAAPVFVSVLGLKQAIAVTGAGVSLLAAARWPALHRLDDRRFAPPALTALLDPIPIFAPLPDAVLEHLATLLRPVSVAAGGVVFAQGDNGDAFYVIERGEADVLIDNKQVRTLRAGDYFGEIALVRDIPRTATIVARTDLQLQKLEREPFLATVTGNPASADAADAVVGARLGLSAGFASI